MTEFIETKSRSRRPALRLELSGRLAAVAGVAGLAVAGASVALDGGAWPTLAAAVSGIVAVLVSGHLLLARPLRQLAASVAALAPEAPAAGGELARAARAVDAVAGQLRLAEWRQARLGAIATVAGNVSHDLRGTLSPALLAAERLQMHAEPGIKRIGDITVRAVERAIELVRNNLSFVREGHHAAAPTRFALREAVAEAAAAARAAMPGVAITVTQDTTVDVCAIRENVVRSLNYLMRHCGTRPATTVVVAVGVTANKVMLDVSGDGATPAADITVSLPPAADEAGLELAIAHDLARSNGGSVVVHGEALRLSLPTVSERSTAPQSAA